MWQAVLVSGLLIAAMCSSFAQTVDPILANAKREPKMLAFSRVIGGSGRERVGAAAVDQQGNIYVTGTTTSQDFPVTPGAMRSPLSCRIMEHNGETQCKAATFLLKLSPDASEILHSATIDSSYSPLVPWTMAVAADGSAYIAGQVYGPEGFPATPGAYRSTCTARDCAFLLKVRPDGSSLEFATFFAGSAGDLPLQILIDSDSRPWITGRVQSTDYPVTADAFQPTPGFGYDDAFLAVFSAHGELVYSTFFGGNGSDGAVGTLLPPTEILFAGSTTSSNFSVTADAFQEKRTAIDPIDSNGFLTVLNTKSGLTYSTYLGGSNDDSLQKAILLPSGKLFFVGGTTSRDFPGAAPDGRSTPTLAAVTGILDPALRHVQARTYPGYQIARILSADERFAYVGFLKGGRSTIVRISSTDNAPVSAYQLPELTAELSGYTHSLKGLLVVADHKYVNFQLPNQTTDIQIRGFRYVERAFAWGAGGTIPLRLLAGQTLTIPITLRDVGAGVPAVVKIRCERIPSDLECSVSPQEMQLEDDATVSVVLRQKPVIAVEFGIPAGLLLLGLTFRNRSRLFLAAVLGLTLVSCRGIPDPSSRSIEVVAESENYRAATTIHFIIEQR